MVLLAAVVLAENAFACSCCLGGAALERAGGCLIDVVEIKEPAVDEASLLLAIGGVEDELVLVDLELEFIAHLVFVNHRVHCVALTTIV